MKKYILIVLVSLFNFTLKGQISTIKSAELANISSKTLYILNHKDYNRALLDGALATCWKLCDYKIVDEEEFKSKVLDTNFVFLKLYMEPNSSTYLNGNIETTVFHGYVPYLHFFTGKAIGEFNGNKEIISENRKGIFFPLSGYYLEYLNVYLRVLENIIVRVNRGETLLSKSDVILRGNYNDYINLKKEKVLLIPASLVKNENILEGFSVAYPYEYKICNPQEIDLLRQKAMLNKYYVLTGGSGGLHTFKYTLSELNTGRIVKYAVVNKFYRFYDYTYSNPKLVRHYQIKSIKMLVRNILR